MFSSFSSKFNFGRSVAVTTTDLYAFSSFTFTNASVSGHRGPTLTNCINSYNTSSNSWLSNTSYFNVTTEGIQQWTVPATANYDIEVAGARGGVNTQASPWISGGYGAVVKTRVSLNKNDILSIVVGQIGADRGVGPTGNFCGAAGGGGTFVYNSSSFDYYAVAGGGGGGASARMNLLSTFLSASGKYNVTSGTTIRITNNYTALGGTNGNGGGVSNRGILYGPAGAGVFSSGNNGKGGGSGQSRISVSGSWWGGTFNPGQSTYGVSGGFGGGAGGGASDGTTFQSYNWAGGGGGYSGGAGGGNGGASDGQYGGGGGSYYIGTFQTGSTGTNNGHGYVKITKV